MRSSINWAPKRRGIRKAINCKTMSEVRDMAKEFVLTKRAVASILMGTVHDPLGIVLPYINNLKLIYRDICRQGTKWDEEISDNMKMRVLEALKHFIDIEKVRFKRKAIFHNATKCTFKIFFDGI